MVDQPVRLRPRNELTASQQLIWTSQRLNPDVPLANMATVSRIDALLDPARFVGAVDAVVAGSDALRLTVVEVDGAPYPSIADEPPSVTEVIELPESELDEWMADRIAMPVDVSTSVYDSVLVKHEADAWSWWMNIHHIATDASSTALIFQGVAAAYDSDWQAGTSYVDLARDLAAQQETPRWNKAKEYWHEAAVDVSPTELYVRDAAPTTLAERRWVEMTASRQHRLDDLLADRFRLLSPDLSLTVALLTVIAGYLSRLNGSDELAVGLPIHHRATAEAKGVIGPIVELFPVTIQIEVDDTFATLQKRISAAVFRTLTNAQPGTSPRQAFDVVLNVHGATFGSFGDRPTSTRWIHPNHIDAHHRLRVQALDYDGTGELELALDINHAVADPDHRRRAPIHLGAVLDAMLADPDLQIRRVDLIAADERLLLEPFTEPGHGTPLDAPVADLVKSQLQRDPSHIAVRCGDERLTAGELDERIEAVATALTAGGIGNGSRVGIEMPLGVDALAAIHGVLRAGASFVPIDPNYPEGRRAHIRSDAGLALVLQSLADLDQLEDRGVLSPPPLPTNAVDGADEAYVIYTSGSTGLPKGVPISQQGLAEYLGFAVGAYVQDEPPVMALFTSLSFDLTITTLFLPLLVGGRVTIHPDGGLPALREIVDDAEVTLLKATPSHLELLVRMIDASHPLAGLIVGGEAFHTDLADRLLAATRPDLRIFNEYGPTEAVVGCMIHRYDPAVDSGAEVPIGRPAPGVALHVLDPVGSAVPLGAVGELFINRPGMARGYLGRPDLNAERFVPHSGGVLYRSGDLVRMLDAERMVYLGRIDQQIKVRGVRLEPGEIEAVAQSVPGVGRGVAALWSPQTEVAPRQCLRCGLGDDVPDIVVDGDGVCSACHAYELVAPQAEAWFRTEADLRQELQQAQARASGDYDVLHLLSGGKDSTYALYRLVELGARVKTITLDNGFISEGAKDNARRATTALGVDHEFVTVDGMNEIFRDSLSRFSNVCNGCYKAIYTIALQRAEDLGIPAIVTGLSRGQFFETRLVPGMFGADRFDPDAIDSAVIEARRAYHQTPDAVSEHMDTSFLDDETIFDRIRFIDFYRYVDVALSDMYEALESSGTWQRPVDTGRSTNCLINSAGIFVHKIEQGHHNYALPYSWDVRLGHKTRAEALEELDDPMDEEEVAAITSMLADVGYEPRRPEVLTLWVSGEPDLEELRQSLEQELPEHARPQAIEVVPHIPLTVNGKVDMASLPAPSARRRSESVVPGRLPTTPMEQRIAPIWADVLSLGDVSATEDFFALGGTSLHALEMIVRVSELLDQAIPEAYAFRYRTLAELADAIQATGVEDLTRPDLSIPALPSDQSPLSAGESAMLFEWRNDPTDVRYNVARLYELPESVDRTRLRTAVEAVVAHQPTLRTSYGPDRRTLAVEEALRFEQRHSSEPISDLAASINRSTFDLVDGPLVTAHVLTSGVSSSVALLLRTHHISSDAASLDVLWDQIDLAYRDQPLPELTSSYAAHGAWQRERASDPAELWSPTDDLGALALRSASADGPDGYVEQLASVTATELRAAAGTTPFATALTALTAALAPFHDQAHFEIAITSSVRDHPDLAPVVGYFLNPLPLIVSGPRELSIGELAERTSELLVNALEHRSIPFADVIRSARERGVVEPTSHVMLAVEDLAPARFDGAEVGHRILASGVAVNDLTFFVQLRDERIDIGCEYRGSAASAPEARRILRRFDEALRALVEQPGVPVHALEHNESVLKGPAVLEAPFVPNEVALRVASQPDGPAVRCDGEQQTFASLDLRARSIAARLRVAGVGPGDRVAIVLPRSVDLPASIMATWMLGASYVPVDAVHPAARVSALTAAAKVNAAITNSTGHAGLGDVVTIDIDRSDAAVLPITRAHETTADDEAYVIFTSGSTGQPKGVPITHGNLAASLAARRAWYDEPVGRFLLLSNAGFDSSVAGLFWSLADAGELIIPTEDQVHDVDALLALIDETQPTHTLCVPSLYGGMLRRARAELDSFDVVIVAGEACPAELIERHARARTSARLINEYGPTEATVWATATELRPDNIGATVPIGGPISGVTARVVNTLNEVVPWDVAGELLISGPTVATNYIAGSDDDDAFIVEDEFGSTYRTGDRVVARESGVIEFLGRIDEQLSIGGVRIEPAEVEHCLTSLPGVSAAVAAEVEGRLVAWVESNLELDGSTLRATAAERLPMTHVPTRVVVTRDLPRTPNGKIDRSKLHEIDAVHASIEKAGQPHARPAEVAAMLDVWRVVFDGVEVDSDDDFFALGGDSLRAVELVTEIEERLGVRVAIGQLVDAPTPRGLASMLEKTGATRTSDGLAEWLRSSGDQTPLIVLPPGGGNLLRYAPLVHALDEAIPVLGLRLPGADARSAVEETIEDQARVMLDALDAAYSGGPYRLLGWSTGGLIAWEIARRLQERGDEVELIALVDTVMGGMHVEAPQSPVDKYRGLLDDGGIATVAAEAGRRARERADFAIARRRYRRTRQRGLVPALVDAERQLGPVIRRASLAYEPEPLDVHAVYFAATESGDDLTVTPWTALLGNLDVVSIEGTHFLPEERCIIGPNKVAELVEALIARL